MGCSSSIAKEEVNGSLKLTLHSASDLPDQDVITKQDVYCKLVFKSNNNKQELRSKTHEGGGKNPKWDYECDFKVEDANPTTDELEIQLWDEDPLFDDFVAIGCWSLQDLIGLGSDSTTVSVFKKGFQETAGELKLTVTWTGTVVATVPRTETFGKGPQGNRLVKSKDEKKGDEGEKESA